jgi:DNA polymerase
MDFIQAVNSCKKCKELSTTRTRVVIGEGPIPCPLVLLGEAPGKKEDEEGRPFIGAAGQHLRTLLNLLRIPEYHILNILKCRPPDNRDPTSQEIQNCRPFLLHQLNALKPKAVIAMGRYAQAFILDESPSKIRVVKNAGKVIRIVNDWNTQAILTYHPAFLLRSQHNEVEKAFRQHLKKGANLAYAV